MSPTVLGDCGIASITFSNPYLSNSYYHPEHVGALVRDNSGICKLDEGGFCSTPPYNVYPSGVYSFPYSISDNSGDLLCSGTISSVVKDICQAPSCILCPQYLTSMFCRYPQFWVLWYGMGLLCLYAALKAISMVGWAMYPYISRASKASIPTLLAPAIAIALLSPGVTAVCTLSGVTERTVMTSIVNATANITLSSDNQCVGQGFRFQGTEYHLRMCITQHTETLTAYPLYSFYADYDPTLDLSVGMIWASGPNMIEAAGRQWILDAFPAAIIANFMLGLGAPSYTAGSQSCAPVQVPPTDAYACSGTAHAGCWRTLPGPCRWEGSIGAAGSAMIAPKGYRYSMHQFDRQADVHTYELCVGIDSIVPVTGELIQMGHTRTVSTPNRAVNVTVTVPSFSVPTELAIFTDDYKFIYDDLNHLNDKSEHAPNIYMGAYPDMNAPFSSSSVCDPDQFSHYAVNFVAENCGDFFDDNLLSHNMLYFMTTGGVVDGTTVIPARAEPSGVGSSNAGLRGRVNNHCYHVVGDYTSDNWSLCVHAISAVIWCNNHLRVFDLGNQRGNCFAFANAIMTAMEHPGDTTNYAMAGMGSGGSRTGTMPNNLRLYRGNRGLSPFGSSTSLSGNDMACNLFRYYGLTASSDIAVDECNSGTVGNGLWRAFRFMGVWVGEGDDWARAGAFRNRLCLTTGQCNYMAMSAIPWRWGFADASQLSPAISPCFTVSGGLSGDGGCFQTQNGVVNRWNIPTPIADGQTRPSAPMAIHNAAACVIAPHLRVSLRTYIQPECMLEPAMKFDSTYDGNLGPNMVCPSLFYLGDCDPPIEDGCHLGRSRDGHLGTTSTAFTPGSSIFDTTFQPDSITFSGEFQELMEFHMSPFFSPFLTAAVSYPAGTGPGHQEYDTFGQPNIVGYETFGETGTQLPTSVTIITSDATKYYIKAFSDPMGCSSPFDQYSNLVTAAGGQYNASFLLFVNGTYAFPCTLQINSAPGDESISYTYVVIIDPVPYNYRVDETQEVTDHTIPDGDDCFLFDPCPGKYGWVFIFIALAVLAALIVLCCCCRGASSTSSVFVKATAPHSE